MKDNIKSLSKVKSLNPVPGGQQQLGEWKTRAETDAEQSGRG